MNRVTVALGTALGGYLSMRPNPLSRRLSRRPHFPRAIMSSTPPPSTSRSNLDSIFNSAIQAYKKKTGNDITSHPLATELQSCDSPDAILAVLRRHIPSSDQSQGGHEGFAKFLIPTVNVLYAFSATLGEGVGLVIIRGSILVENPCSNIGYRFSHRRK